MLSEWAPILPRDGPIASTAWDTVDVIAQSILTHSYPPSSPSRRQHSKYEESLLFGYLACALDDAMWRSRAIDSLNGAIDDVETLRRNLSLFGGLSGLGWVAEHISSLLGEPSEFSNPGDAEASAGDIDVRQYIDSILLRNLRYDPWQASYDLIGGLVGFGVYLFERLPCSSGVAEGFLLILKHLETLSESTPDGITWHTDTKFLPEEQRRRTPSGYYNLGVAHGVPGVIHFLSQLATARIEERRARALLDPAVDWLFAQQRPRGSRSRFSPYITCDESSDSRLSWCYGDLGILAILLQVVSNSSSACWKDYSSELLEHCLAWPSDQAGINDAQLCHGSAGVAHIFNRLYHISGDARCRDRALYWLEQTLARRVPNAGVGGYLASTKPDPAGAPVLEPSPAFLDGAIGIALSLIAALTPVEPQWDRLLLLSRTPVEEHGS
jgi:hypothetical protein